MGKVPSGRHSCAGVAQRTACERWLGSLWGRDAHAAVGLGRGLCAKSMISLGQVWAEVPQPCL